MIGARKNTVEKGFEVAGFRMSSICVKDQRKPDDAAAVMTKINPRTLNEVSPATIRTTPAVIVVMMAKSFQEGFSSRNRKANIRTKPRTDDLHIASSLLDFF